ncbi:hypothetical protein, partial [Floridanema evergladense]
MPVTCHWGRCWQSNNWSLDYRTEGAMSKLENGKEKLTSLVGNRGKQKVAKKWSTNVLITIV